MEAMLITGMCLNVAVLLGVIVKLFDLEQRIKRLHGDFEDLVKLHGDFDALLQQWEWRRG